jgi:hypothetical protein
MFAPPEGEIVDAVESNAMGRDGRVVEIGEPQSPLVAEVWLA